MKITRENLNSVEADALDIFQYVMDIADRGDELTQAETIILAFICEHNQSAKDRIDAKGGVISSVTQPTLPALPIEFSEAMEKYKAMLDENAGIETDEARDQFAKAMLLAPDWFHEMAMSEAKTMGLIPKATHCLENGEPVFSLEEIAAHLGISLEDAQKSLNKLITQREEMGLEGVRAIDPSTVNKIQ